MDSQRLYIAIQDEWSMPSRETEVPIALAQELMLKWATTVTRTARNKNLRTLAPPGRKAMHSDPMSPERVFVSSSALRGLQTQRF
jgi:hypothetical protein